MIEAYFFKDGSAWPTVLVGYCACAVTITLYTVERMAGFWVATSYREEWVS